MPCVPTLAEATEDKPRTSRPARTVRDRSMSKSLAGNPEDDLPELLPGLEALVGGTRLRERKDLVDDRHRAAGLDELVGALEVLVRAHGRAEDGELLPPDPVQQGGRIRARCRAADGHAPAGPDHV